ncbi:MAG: flagellar export chaperone FlgN [Acidimicrobiales bacterium]
MGERLTELSEVLWREREALDLVLFKLEEQRLLLQEPGMTRWLGHANREIDVVLDQLCEMELNRAVACAAAAAELGVEDDARLGALAAAAPPPWPCVIERHIAALRRLADEVLILAGANRILLLEGLAEVRGGMDAPPRRPSTRLLVDAASYSAALATNERVLHPSLVDAVRG